MRKKLVVIIPLLLVLGYTFFLYSYQPKIENHYVKEYTNGNGIKGMVDKNKFELISSDFEIGATEEGYAVFKDPNKAFETFKVLYKEELSYVKRDNLIILPICYSNLNKYSRIF